MNLTLSDVYSEQAATVSRIFEIIFVLFQIFMAPLLFYVTMTQSKQMEIYRFYLMNTVVWNTIAEILLALTSPSLLSPYACIIFDGFLSLFKFESDETFLFPQPNVPKAPGCHA